MDESGTWSYSVAGFGISDVETSGCTIKVFSCGLDYDAFCIEDHTASNFRTINLK